MGASKEDMRSTRTRRACKRALLDLMRETDFQGITVTDIASRAEISRVTFYRHYPTTADVLADIAKDVMDEYAERRRGIVYPDASLRTGVEQRCLLFYSHFADHAEYYSAMLGRHGIPSFEPIRISIICASPCSAAATPSALRGDSRRPLRACGSGLLANYVVYAQLGLAKFWLMEGCETDVHTVAKVAADFTYTLLSDQSTLVISENER